MPEIVVVHREEVGNAVDPHLHHCRVGQFVRDRQPVADRVGKGVDADKARGRRVEQLLAADDRHCSAVACRTRPRDEDRPRPGQLVVRPDVQFIGDAVLVDVQGVPIRAERAARQSDKRRKVLAVRRPSHEAHQTGETTVGYQNMAVPGGDQQPAVRIDVDVAQHAHRTGLEVRPLRNAQAVVLMDLRVDRENVAVGVDRDRAMVLGQRDRAQQLHRDRMIAADNGADRGSSGRPQHVQQAVHADGDIDDPAGAGVKPLERPVRRVVPHDPLLRR